MAVGQAEAGEFGAVAGADLDAEPVVAVGEEVAAVGAEAAADIDELAWRGAEVAAEEGGEFAAAFEPIEVPPPGLLSMMTGWPSRGCRCCTRRRANTSLGDPGV